MKKATFLAAAMLMGLSVTASPLNTMAASNVRATVITASECEDIFQEYLENCNWNNMHVITIPCQPEDLENILGNICLPEAGQPETPDVENPEAPDMEQPGIPDVETPEAPDMENPETPDVETPEIPDVENPETPDAEMPEIPDVENPGTPDIETPEAPEVNQPQPETPDTNTPEMEQPGEEDSEQSVHAYVLRIVELVNEERAKAGLNALTLNENVTAAAQVRAEESEILFSHTRPDGTSFSTALKEAGVSYRGAGENIAWGQKTPEQVMEGWMNSAGHRANILNEKYTTIGVGYYQNEAGVNYWSQLFTY